MKLTAKIKAKYLDRILKGEKEIEYRQFETITFEDENGRKATYEIVEISELMRIDDELIQQHYPDIPWKTDQSIYEIILGEKK